MDGFIHATTGELPFVVNMSHRLVRVETIDDHWLETCTELMSHRITELVFEHICTVTRAWLSETLVQHLANPYAHTKAGILFKHVAHFTICGGLTLTSAPLSLDLKMEVSISVLSVGDNEKSHYYSLDIQESSGLKKVHPNFLNLYIIPISESEPSIDALLISSTYTTFLFQMTVSEHHPISFEGLNKVVSKLPAKARKDI
jgi:hypothetical protein